MFCAMQRVWGCVYECLYGPGLWCDSRRFIQVHFESSSGRHTSLASSNYFSFSLTFFPWPLSLILFLSFFRCLFLFLFCFLTFYHSLCLFSLIFYLTLFSLPPVSLSFSLLLYSLILFCLLFLINFYLSLSLSLSQFVSSPASPSSSSTFLLSVSSITLSWPLSISVHQLSHPHLVFLPKVFFFLISLSFLFVPSCVSHSFCPPMFVPSLSVPLSCLSHSIYFSSIYLYHFTFSLFLFLLSLFHPLFLSSFLICLFTSPLSFLSLHLFLKSAVCLPLFWFFYFLSIALPHFFFFTPLVIRPSLSLWSPRRRHTRMPISDSARGIWDYLRFDTIFQIKLNEMVQCYLQGSCGHSGGLPWRQIKKNTYFFITDYSDVRNLSLPLWFALQ